ncbi:type II toxin-antitoxin system VapC family toxin [Candidatus Bathyarchaeota archaeon]|nr:type II toxin-antitoxin system VapC family toxin [Candidatus Bathyarchaeota archaeon]
MTVIDASSLAKYILREENWEEVRDHLLNAYSNTLALAEVSNSIWKHQILHEAVSREVAELMFSALKKLWEDVILFEPFEKYLEDAFEISMKTKITFYDAVYLAQAKTHGELLTSDEKQRRAAEKIGVKVKYID